MAAEIIRIVGAYWSLFAVLAVMTTLIAMRWSAYQRGRTICAEAGHLWVSNEFETLECARCGANPF